MTWDGRDATYSPVPQTSQPWTPPPPVWTAPSAPTAAYAPQAQPYDYRPIGSAPPPTAPSRKKSKAWIVILVGVLLLGLVIAGIVFAAGRAGAQGPALQEISDSEGRVTVRVPASWDDFSEPPEEPDPAFSSEENAEYAWDFPIVDAEGSFGDKTVLVFAEAISDRSVEALQAHGVQQQCYQDCKPGPIQPITIDGRVGIQQELIYDDGSATVIATVRSAKWTVQIVAEEYTFLFGTVDPGPLHERVNAVTIHD